MTLDLAALDQADQLTLLAAFQVLSVPSGTLGARHKDARRALVQLTGHAPRRAGIPAPGATLEAYIAWHERRCEDCRHPYELHRRDGCKGCEVDGNPKTCRHCIAAGGERAAGHAVSAPRTSRRSSSPSDVYEPRSREQLTAAIAGLLRAYGVAGRFVLSVRHDADELVVRMDARSYRVRVRAC